MKQYQTILISLLLLTACSPKYITKTIKVPPSTKEDKACFSSCNKKYETGKREFIQKCQNEIVECTSKVKNRVTANFSLYEKKYRKELVNYKRNMISYREKLDSYRDIKSELREEYNNAMDKYYDKKHEYRKKLSEYEDWKQKKDEYQINRRKCHLSSKNKNACQKVKEYEDKHRFTSYFDRPKKPIMPTKPHKPIHISKPIKPLRPSKPILSNIIKEERAKCKSSCNYPLENSCFKSCGGVIKYKKVCVEHCE